MIGWDSGFTWLFGLNTMLMSMIACMSQLFLAWRLQIFMKNHLLKWFTIALSLLALSAFTAVIILVHVHQPEKSEMARACGHGINLFADTALTMFWMYAFARELAGALRPTARVLRKLMQCAPFHFCFRNSANSFSHHTTRHIHTDLRRHEHRALPTHCAETIFLP